MTDGKTAQAGEMRFGDLKGKTALVTGASGGIGLHLAQTLASQGISVILAARRTEKLDEVCAEMNAAGHSARAVALDVADSGSVDRAFETIGPVPDIIVNNAGISAEGPALATSGRDWDRVLSTNLTGSFLVAQRAANGMVEAGRGGAIVNIASITGLRVAGGVIAYTTSKAAVIQMTKALALEWARYGIRVNALCPGYIETDINRDFFATDAGRALIKRIPQRRLGQMQELDGPLLLLCSQAGSYITGATLAADGGHLVSSL